MLEIVKSDSKSLDAEIEVGRQALLAHPQYLLEPKYRLSIYLALTPSPTANLEEVSADRILLERCTSLGILAARKVISLWDDVRPADDFPHRMLTVAEDALSSNEPNEDASTFVATAWSLLESMGAGSHNDASMRSFFAAASAQVCLRTAVSKKDEFVESLRKLPVDHLWREADLDFNNTDAAGYAAMAYSCPAWSNCFDHMKSREFWLWWLNECVPEACNGFPA